MLAVEKTSLTSGKKIDSSRILYCGDFKGLTPVRKSIRFSSSLKKTKGSSAHRKCLF